MATILTFIRFAKYRHHTNRESVQIFAKLRSRQLRPLHSERRINHCLLARVQRRVEEGEKLCIGPGQLISSDFAISHLRRTVLVLVEPWLVEQAAANTDQLSSLLLLCSRQAPSIILGFFFISCFVRCSISLGRTMGSICPASYIIIVCLAFVR